MLTRLAEQVYHHPFLLQSLPSSLRYISCLSCTLNGHRQFTGRSVRAWAACQGLPLPSCQLHPILYRNLLQLSFQKSPLTRDRDPVLWKVSLNFLYCHAVEKIVCSLKTGRIRLIFLYYTTCAIVIFLENSSVLFFFTKQEQSSRYVLNVHFTQRAMLQEERRQCTILNSSRWHFCMRCS